MLTVMMLFVMLLVLSFIVAVLWGLIAVSPMLLVIVGLLLMDIFVIKTIIKRKKTK